jgi:hypothetical protein
VLEHLDFAVKEFREMKMQPSLERTLRHKEILKSLTLNIALKRYENE